MKRPSSSLEYDFKSAYMPGFNPSDGLLYKISVGFFVFATEPQSKSDVAYPWPEELSYELLQDITAQFSDKGQEDKMDTGKPPATLLQLPKYKCTTGTVRQKNSLILYYCIQYET